MNYLFTKDGFELIPDPYGNKRVCYKYKMIDIDIIRELAQDANFLYIIDGIIYFKAS